MSTTRKSTRNPIRIEIDKHMKNISKIQSSNQPCSLCLYISKIVLIITVILCLISYTLYSMVNPLTNPINASSSTSNTDTNTNYNNHNRIISHVVENKNENKNNLNNIDTSELFTYSLDQSLYDKVKIPKKIQKMIAKESLSTGSLKTLPNLYIVGVFKGGTEEISML